MNSNDWGATIRRLRTDRGISLRQLSRLAAMAPASLSAIESGASSPTLATLSRILAALGMGFADFFSNDGMPEHEPVFHHKDMRSVRDAHRNYILVYPRRKDVKFQMIREVLEPETRSEWETHQFDIGGLVLTGGPLKVEVDGQGQWEISAGDAFYISAGKKHRATNIGKRPLTQVTVAYPPRY